MKQLVLICLLVLGFSACQGPQKEVIKEEEKIIEKVMEKGPEKLLRHVVLFKFKEASSEAEVQTVIDAFVDLKNKIDFIYDFEWGTDVSPEGLQDGFTHCFVATFTSEEDRDAYLPHPDHQAFVKVLEPHLDKVLVVDFWNK